MAMNTCFICGRVDSPLIEGICRDCKAIPPVAQPTPQAANRPTNGPSASLTAVVNSPATAGGTTRYFVPQQVPLETNLAEVRPPVRSPWWSGLKLISCGLSMNLMGIALLLVATSHSPPPTMAPVAMLIAVPLLVAGEIFLLAGTIRWGVAPLWERLEQRGESRDRKD